MLLSVQMNTNSSGRAQGSSNSSVFLLACWKQFNTHKQHWRFLVWDRYACINKEQKLQSIFDDQHNCVVVPQMHLSAYSVFVWTVSANSFLHGASSTWICSAWSEISFSVLQECSTLGHLSDTDTTLARVGEMEVTWVMRALSLPPDQTKWASLCRSSLSCHPFI